MTVKPLKSEVVVAFSDVKFYKKSMEFNNHRVRRVNVKDTIGGHYTTYGGHIHVLRFLEPTKLLQTSILGQNRCTRSCFENLTI